MAHQDLGRGKLTRIANQLSEYGWIEIEPRTEGRVMHLVMAPGRARRPSRCRSGAHRDPRRRAECTSGGRSAAGRGTAGSRRSTSQVKPRKHGRRGAAGLTRRGPHTMVCGPLRAKRLRSLRRGVKPARPPVRARDVVRCQDVDAADLLVALHRPRPRRPPAPWSRARSPARDLHLDLDLGRLVAR